MMLAIGAGIDYARLIRIHSKMKTATDSAALSAALITSDPANPYNTNVAGLQQAAAVAAFNANIGDDAGLTASSVALTQIAGGVHVTSTGTSTNAFGGLFGLNTNTLSANAEAGVSLVSNSMEIAFVLDNTGSMGQLSKMPLLKAAMQKFLAKLQAGINNTSNVKMAIVPFDTKVKLDPVFANGKPWMRQTPAALSGWQGCVMDRVQPYDTNATTPSLGVPDTLVDGVDGAGNIFPTATPTACSLPTMLPLTTSFPSVNAAVNSMAPNGSTNGTIGLAWGLQALTPGEPFSTAASFGSVRKIIVFLTDGANTQNRWTTTPALIDARMLAACTEIKANNIELFTIGLVDANMSVLTPCATNASMAFQVTDPSRIPDLFDLVSQQFVGIRLTQ